jgi:formylmethanofuran dehydrogenase subunit B
MFLEKAKEAMDILKESNGSLLSMWGSMLCETPPSPVSWEYKMLTPRG